MSTPYLLDTNVLVYAYDGADRTKHLRALDVLGHLGGAGRASIPAQALAELSSVALRKLRPPLEPAHVYRIVEEIEAAFSIVPLTPAVVLEALRGVRDHAMSYYDAQIWAAAKLAQIPVVLSEDFATGSMVEGVTFLDPFASDLDVLGL
ncbi:MAG: PIN domain-containing protein [Myxococcota bacterium]|nr:PIN domain-containing protein [Myxococcota bacterium]